MKEYILREDVLNEAFEPIETYITDEIVCVEDIKSIPAADVKEVVHATWIGKPIAGYSTVRCSNCKSVFRENTGKWKYCPDCGAKMDKVIKEKF